jgi:DNA-binding PadR family transcriptional regulator
MHPYEISTLMRERGMSYSIKLNFGSLYATIAGLLVAGKIAVKATEREGNLPERTVYTITPSGLTELQGTITGILETPAKEYPRFTAGLTMLGHLVPDRVIELLNHRLTALKTTIEHDTAVRERALSDGVDEMFLLELEYSVALQRAELAWVEALIPRISGAFARSTGGALRWRFLEKEDSHGND